MLPHGTLAERIGRYLQLTSAETATLDSMESPPRMIARGTQVGRDRDGGHLVCVLRTGWAATALTLADGSRQITKVHLPGDLLGMPGLSSHGATDVITTLTDATITTLAKPAFGQLFADHPRIGALMFLVAQAERVAMGDRMASIGRTDARARLALLLLDFLNRMRKAVPDVTDSFVLPMTQEEIGDVIGLTAVHVNRMMRALAEEQLIERSAGGLIRVADEQRMVRLSGYVNRLAKPDLSWLPAAH